MRRRSIVLRLALLIIAADLATPATWAATPSAAARRIEEREIRSRRAQSNARIAARDAAGLRTFFANDIKLIGSSGGLILGADAVEKAFRERLADPAVSYVRTTDDVTLDRAGVRAAETGHWIGVVRIGEQPTKQSGTYMAVWNRSAGVWVLESELYILLD